MTKAFKIPILSAFKRAADGNGEVLRFWSWDAETQEVRLRPPEGVRRINRTDLLERSGEELISVDGWVRLPVRPFELFTLRWEI